MITLTNPKKGGVTVPEYYGELASAPAGTPTDLSGYADTSLLELFKYYSGSWHAIYLLASMPTSTPGGLTGQMMGVLGLTYS